MQYTHRSRAEIEGGSAINSNSGGGSFGTKGCSICLKISCCFCCCTAETESLFSADGKSDEGSWPTKIKIRIYV